MATNPTATAGPAAQSPSSPRRLHDVADTERFVRATIAKRPGKPLSLDVRTELLAAGMLKMVELAKQYRPGFGGRDPLTSRFSGYAAVYLPRKLEDALHHLNGDTLAAMPDGTRQWRYHEPPVSLDDPDQTQPASASPPTGQSARAEILDLRLALHQTVSDDVQIAEKVGVLLLAGYTPREIARELRAPQVLIDSAVTLIDRSRHLMHHDSP